ncbi:alpha/beta hydrolase [Streptomyces sp. NPDC002790]|uniref:alpha/beta fold hydrolase n=1 Tax=Streptomyces sp. NPDC002790 TaxID=3154431 RepID=UPI003325A8BB
MSDLSDLFWIDEGTGRPLVLLHGGFLDHHMWDDQIAHLAAAHRVIAPDARGHGRSPNAAGPFRHTDDLAALLRQLGVGPAVLVGISMGASIAIDTALEHPALVGGVVISGAGTSEPYFTDPWTTGIWTTWQAAMAAGDVAAAVEAFTVFGAGPHRTLSDIDPRVVDRLRTMTWNTMSKHTAEEPDWSVPLKDTWLRAAAIPVPVRAVNGALDSPDHIGMAERLTSSVTDGLAVSIPDVAHYPNMEHPEAFNQALAAFLRDM